MPRPGLAPAPPKHFILHLRLLHGNCLGSVGRWIAFNTTPTCPKQHDCAAQIALLTLRHGRRHAALLFRLSRSSSTSLTSTRYDRPTRKKQRRPRRSIQRASEATRRETWTSAMKSLASDRPLCRCKADDCRVPTFDLIQRASAFIRTPPSDSYRATTCRRIYHVLGTQAMPWLFYWHATRTKPPVCWAGPHRSPDPTIFTAMRALRGATDVPPIAHPSPQLRLGTPRQHQLAGPTPASCLQAPMW